MRHIICPICGSGDKTKIYDATLPAGFDENRPPNPYSAHYRINRCDGCDLVHSSPIMEEAGVAALYEQGSEANVEAGEEPNVGRTMAGYYKLAAPYLAGRTRILDVGCDMGFLLQVARDDGFSEIQGLEPVPVARAIAEKIPGAQIRSEFFEEISFPPEYFDMISFIHVIDHLFDPEGTLVKAYQSLRDGGLVVAVVHDVDSLLGRTLKERFPIFNLYHHYFFNKLTLAALFKSKGYEVIKVVNTYNCYSFSFFIRRFPGLPKAVKKALSRFMNAIGVGRIPLYLSVGNIGIVARRPYESAITKAEQ